MTKTVLVTGASGFIGRQLVPLLVAEAYALRVLVRSAAATTQFADEGLRLADICTGTLPDKALAARLCEGVDVVIHAAGLAHVNADAAALRAANVDATLELAHAARAQGVRRFIFLSSSKARYPAHSRYAEYKAEAEAELRKLHADDFEVVCLRPALVYGHGMRGNLRSLLRVLARRRLPVFPGSTQQLGLISAQDLCRALVQIVLTEQMPDKIWELADGQVYTLNDMVRNLRETLGLPPPLWLLPRELFRMLAAMASMTGSSLSLSTYRTLFEENYEQDAAFSRHTGFVPKDTFFSRLPELLEDLQ